MFARMLIAMLLAFAARPVGAEEPNAGEFQPVVMTGLAKSAFFLLRSLADAKGGDPLVGARILTDEAGFEKFRKELETQFGLGFQRQTFERSEMLLTSRPYQYEDDEGAPRTVRLRALPESADKGTRRLIEFRGDDAPVDQAVAKLRLHLPEETALLLFKREEFLARKKEIQRLAEKDPANEGVPVREMLNLVELLHLSARQGPRLSAVTLSYQRTKYRLEIPRAGKGQPKAIAEVVVDQAIRLSGAKGELIHDSGKGGAARRAEITRGVAETRQRGSCARAGPREAQRQSRETRGRARRRYPLPRVFRTQARCSRGAHCYFSRKLDQLIN